MSAVRKKRVESSERACLQCKRRKTRCIPLRDSESCTYCTKMSKSCVFGEPTSRTPLTRKNLDDAELRCKRLETLLEQLQPGIDVGANLENGTSLAEVNESRADNTLSSPNYEWQETSDLNDLDRNIEDEESRNGMASLSAGSGDTGYQGGSSGFSLLKSISSLLPAEVVSSPAKDPGRPTLAQQRSPYPNFTTAAQMASKFGHEHLINTYFLAYNSSYPILHESSFRERCSKRSEIARDSPWHIIYYTVLALGEWICGYGNDDHSLYYEAARSRLRIDILESGNMGIVQAFLLLGNYLQKRDRPNTGYNFIGIAYRVALGLGLHREISSGKESESFAMQRRRLLFWTLYCFESGFSLTTGRPNMVEDSFIDLRKPRNIDDSLTTTLSTPVHEVDYPTTCSAIIAQARLAVIANKVHSDFLSTHACSNVDHSIAVMEQSIQNWRSSLPSFFFQPDVPKWFLGPRQVVLWKEANLRILLLLAGQRQHTDEHDKMTTGTKCQSVAVQAILDITNFCKENPELVHMGISWYCVYFLLQAILALGGHRLREQSRRTTAGSLQNNSASEAWEMAITKAYECLKNLGRSNRAANRTLKILDRLHNNVRPSPSGVGSQHNVDGSPSFVTNNSGGTLRSTTNNNTHNSSVGATNSNAPAFNPDQFSRTGMVNVFPSTSPTDAIATDYLENEWVANADPSLHVFLDDTQSIDQIFQDIQGFPSTMEQENFAYMTSSMQTLRGSGGSTDNQWSLYESLDGPYDGRPAF